MLGQALLNPLSALELLKGLGTECLRVESHVYDVWWKISRMTFGGRWLEHRAGFREQWHEDGGTI